MRKIIPRVVTSADKNYFNFLIPLSLQIQKLFKQKLIVYDLGLTREQIEILKEVAEIRKTNFDQSFRELDRNYFIKTTHKIDIIYDLLINYSDPFMLIDADCFIIEKLKFKHDFDIGLTRRHLLELKPKLLINGKINAGVIIVLSTNNKNVINLIKKWKKYCLQQNVSDQKGLSDILDGHIDWKNTKKIQEYDGIKIKIFEAEIYNDVKLKTGKIFHFKNAGRFQKNEEIFNNFIKTYNNTVRRKILIANIKTRRLLFKSNIYYKKHKTKLTLLDKNYK